MADDFTLVPSGEEQIDEIDLDEGEKLDEDEDASLSEEGEGAEGAEDEGGEPGTPENKPGAEAPTGEEQERGKGPSEAAKAARITGEREGSERARRERDEAVKAQRIPDPYNPGKFFESVDDIVKYGRRLRADSRKVSPEEIEREDSDKDFIRRKREEERITQEAQQKRTEKLAWLRADAAAFKAAYPEADPVKLEGNAAFVKFCGSRLHNEPLADLYGAYVELVGEAKAAGAARRESREERAVGTGSGGGADVLTSAQKAELARWNRENPDMKMSAKEFLAM